MNIDNIKTLIEIVNGTVTTLAIFAAGWWFFWRRSLAGSLQITLTLTDVTLINNTRIAVVRVQLKNVGQTRIKKDYCACLVQEVDVWSDSETINILPKETFNYSQGRKIFDSPTGTEIEPNEETFEDVVLALNESTFFRIGVWFSKKGTTEAWQSIAAFNIDAQTKVPSTINLLAERTAKPA
jgi:hypothetical protein